MNKLMSLAVPAILGALLGACGGAGASGPSCAAVCDYVVSCDAEETLVTCTAECEEMRDLFRPAVFAFMGDCMLGLTCLQYNADGGDICMQGAMAAGNASAGTDLVRSMCKKAVSCDPSGTYTQEACVAQLTAEAGDTLDYMGMLRDSVLTCYKACVNDTPCALLEEAMDACYESCGLPLGEDGGNANP